MLGLRFCARAFSSCGKRGPLVIAASLVAEHRLQTRRFSSCGSRALLLRGMWDLPRPGLEPVSPALAGRLNHCATREALIWLFYLSWSLRRKFCYGLKVYFCLVSWASFPMFKNHLCFSELCSYGLPIFLLYYNSANLEELLNVNKISPLWYEIHPPPFFFSFARLSFFFDSVYGLTLFWPCNPNPF